MVRKDCVLRIDTPAAMGLRSEVGVIGRRTGQQRESTRRAREGRMDEPGTPFARGAVQTRRSPTPRVGGVTFSLLPAREDRAPCLRSRVHIPPMIPGGALRGEERPVTVSEGTLRIGPALAWRSEVPGARGRLSRKRKCIATTSGIPDIPASGVTPENVCIRGSRRTQPVRYARRIGKAKCSSISALTQ